MKPYRLWRHSKLFLSVAAASLTFTSAGHAQEEIEEIVVTGIRGALQNAIAEKRASDNLVEVILAEDIGKLPDQNLAEVLENVTGIQITRTAGVGTGVQIRGTNSNRTEINGVATSGSGAGRSGIDFEDISAGIIAGVEVTKAPEAKTTEGSVGGTINLRTIRPLALTERVASARVQFEESSLSDESPTPRVSGTWGDNWTTDSGDFGIVLSGSYAESDVTSFRPRVDRDNSVFASSGVASAQSFDYLPIQFFIQEIENFEYETTNLAGTFEWAPNDDLKFYFDAIINDQTSRQESSRIQASGISNLRDIQAPSSFETVNFGTVETSSGSVAVGSIQAALTGNIPIEPGTEDDGNLRYSSDTNSRVTDSQILSLGAEWQITDRLASKFEIASSSNDSSTPNINTTLNFINPNALKNDSNENGTPFVYDLSGGSLAFGIDHSAAGAPSVADLTNPANVVLRDVQQSRSITENSEDAFRFDLSYDLDMSALTTIDFGFRRSEVNSLQDVRNLNLGLRSASDSPTGDLFSGLLIEGPDNFNKADGRELYVANFLTINPELVASDYDGVIAGLNAAIVAHGGSSLIDSPTSSTSSFFSIDEETNALYAQANFEAGIFRGNVGARYVETDVTSNGFSEVDGVVSPTVDKGSYDFILPRINLVADVSEDVIVRAGWGKDINRPGFNRLSSAFTFSTSPNPAVTKGNPAVEPEEVTSFDISAEWYFAPSSLLSIGYFNKKRTGLIFTSTESPLEDSVTGFRDTTGPVCEGGGIFNPIADINVFGSTPGVGVCVPLSTSINGAGQTTQKGLELAFQYDLSDFEDKLGWASGFGLIANYTKQEFSGGDEFYDPTSRADAVFTSLGQPDLDLRQTLPDLSENSYNITVFYEKYGISARARYTWREAFRTLDFVGTSSLPWGFPAVTEDRGQLNASISYDVNDNMNIGLEVINVTESDVVQSCVNEGGLLCYQGLTDRRIILGASYKF